MGQPLYSVSVAGVVINNDGQLLAIRRRDNHAWEPPGGILEVGERLHDGLKREVTEETGLWVEPEALTGVYQNMTRHIVAFVFRCHVVGGHLHTTAESSEVAWLTPDQIAARMSEAFAIRLLDATEPTADDFSPHIRYHDGRSLHPAPV